MDERPAERWSNAVTRVLMRIKGIQDEDFVNYKKPSMVVVFPTCTFKCDKENKQQVCQNSALAATPNIEIAVTDIVARYISNNITKAIVFAGLEPFDSFKEMLVLGRAFRTASRDDIVIYTGYTENEVLRMKDDGGFYADQIRKELSPCIIKYGRYIPNQNKHYDETLGVWLASDNQYAKVV